MNIGDDPTTIYNPKFSLSINLGSNKVEIQQGSFGRFQTVEDPILFSLVSHYQDACQQVGNISLKIELRMVVRDRLIELGIIQ